MTTNLLPPFKPSLPRPIGRSTPSSSWWTPLFGWSSEPDYLDFVSTTANLKIPSKTAPHKEGAEVMAERSSRLRSVRFTEEKARLLRKMMPESGSFPHEMYHSAIAARLASDFVVQSDP